MFNRKAGPEQTRFPQYSRGWWALGIARSVAAFLIVYAPAHWIEQNYSFAYNFVRGANCLPYGHFLISRRDRELHRGDYVAFTAEQMEPFYRNGTLAVKIVAGIPGDHVVVRTEGIWINGRYWGALVHVQPGKRLRSLGRRPADYVRDETVPPHQLWVMGTSPDSYDSRYWGEISDDQVLGRAHPLW